MQQKTDWKTNKVQRVTIGDDEATSSQVDRETENRKQNILYRLGYRYQKYSNEAVDTRAGICYCMNSVLEHMCCEALGETLGSRYIE